MKKKQILLLFLFFYSFGVVNAKIKVATIIGDNMVLQRNSEINLWGTANPKESLSIKAGWNNFIYKTVCDAKGAWIVKVKTTEAGGPYSISIKTLKEEVILKNILLGEVWVCSGQSNMEMPVDGFLGQPVIGTTDILLNAINNNIRMFIVKKNSATTPQDTCGGSWLVSDSETATKFSAVGYLFAKQLYESLNIPIGVIGSYWGGTGVTSWMNSEAAKKFPDAIERIMVPKVKPQHRISSLYNGMISPIINYGIKGAIWYQGENNVPYYSEYASMLQSMVKSWREDFEIGDFPFYYVQIAPFAYKNSNDITSALMRSEQEKAMSLIPNSGMVSIVDLGEEHVIHPSEKKTVATRLALWALSETYNFKGLDYKSPVFKSMSVKDSLVTITFENESKGFSTFGKDVDCFEVAGKDSVFYPAKMRISKKTVVVVSPKVHAPVAVRYAFKNFSATRGFLYSTSGLPVSSFRTDNWQNKIATIKNSDE